LQIKIDQSAITWWVHHGIPCAAEACRLYLLFAFLQPRTIGMKKIILNPAALYCRSQSRDPDDDTVSETSSALHGTNLFERHNQNMSDSQSLLNYSKDDSIIPQDRISPRQRADALDSSIETEDGDTSYLFCPRTFYNSCFPSARQHQDAHSNDSQEEEESMANPYLYDTASESSQLEYQLFMDDEQCAKRDDVAPPTIELENSNNVSERSIIDCWTDMTSQATEAPTDVESLSSPPLGTRNTLRFASPRHVHRIVALPSELVVKTPLNPNKQPATVATALIRRTNCVALDVETRNDSSNWRMRSIAVRDHALSKLDADHFQTDNTYIIALESRMSRSEMLSSLGIHDQHTLVLLAKVKSALCDVGPLYQDTSVGVQRQRTTVPLVSVSNDFSVPHYDAYVANAVHAFSQELLPPARVRAIWNQRVSKDV
jgi:hypothetical protein